MVNYMQHNGSLKKELYKDIEVTSVDAFQGQRRCVPFEFDAMLMPA